MSFTHSMSQFRLAGFQMLNGYMWLMATVLTSSALDYFCGYVFHFSLNVHNRSGVARSHLQRWLVFLQFSSVAQSCPTLCNPMNCSMAGLPVHHQPPEYTQTHFHRVSDAVQPSLILCRPFSSCPQSLPASESFPMSQIFT